MFASFNILHVAQEFIEICEDQLDSAFAEHNLFWKGPARSKRASQAVELPLPREEISPLRKDL